MNYAANDDGKFEPEYAEVYGVPFSFIPSTGQTGETGPKKIPTRVKALADRSKSEISFPRLVGYRFDLPDGQLRADFSGTTPLLLSTGDLQSKTEMAGKVGEVVYHEMNDINRLRKNTVAFEIARDAMARFRDSEDNERPWLFPQVLEITKQWMDNCVVLKDNATIGWLALSSFRADAVDRLYSSIVQGERGEARLLPMLRPYDAIGSTRYVDFDSTKPVLRTNPEKCHVSHVVADTNSWEQKMAQVLEDMDEVRCYVKNEGLGFSIPYAVDGEQRRYVPDFLARVDDGHGDDDLLTLIVEVSGQALEAKQAKVTTARDLWVPAVNNLREFGRWAFIEIADPWDAENAIRALLGARDEVPA
jgi:type III restriction enzyme